MAEASREVIYRGPAQGGLQVDGRVVYPGDTLTLSDRRIGRLIDKGGHRFQNVGGDIVRLYELGEGIARVVGPENAREAATGTLTKPEDAERDARLAEAQAAAHALDSAESALVENQQVAAGETEAKSKGKNR